MNANDFNVHHTVFYCMRQLSENEIRELTRKFFELQAEVDDYDMALHNLQKFISENKEILEKLDVDWEEVKAFYRHVFALVVSILIDLSDVKEVKVRFR